MLIYNYLRTIWVTLLKDSTKAKELIKKALLKGQSLEKTFTKGNHANYRKSKYFIDLEKDYKAIYSFYLNNVDVDYLLALTRMHGADQAIRNSKFMNALFGPDSACFKNPYNSAVSYVDSSNFKKLLALCEKKGFPSRKIVGDFGHQKAWLLLWHQRNTYPDTPEWKKMMVYINEAISKKLLEPSFLAIFEDNRRFFNKEPQLYGTIFNQIRFSPDYDQTTIKDPKNLNNRRKEIGLPPFELDIKSMGMELPKSYSNLVTNDSFE